MTELLTAAQMKAIETAAIESGEVTGLELMERAGRGVVEAVFKEWPELAKTSHRAVVLCGPGNNGGDGFVVARLLKQWGWRVEVFLYGDAEKLPPDAKVNYERWLEVGEVEGWNPKDIKKLNFDLIVDAIFGAGLSRAPEPEILKPLSDLYTSSKTFDRMVAIDCPTGICMDSGRELSQKWSAVFAFLTITFHKPRIGHYLGDGPQNCNAIRIVDIGLPDKINHTDNYVQLSSPEISMLGKWGADHKFGSGHALILSGSSGCGGAARLAARGALRIGAGLVTVGCPHQALVENASQLNAIMLTEVDSSDALTQVLADRRINALCLGPGFGIERAQGLVPVALASKTHLVLDADALTAVSRAPDLFAKLHKNCVLTPHAGEFSRLFPDIAEKLNAPAPTGPAYSKVDATRDAAKRAGCVVLFKGADTVIAAPDGRAAINSAHYERAAPWLATAGSGDVLAGFITGLLARGFAPMQAAETAAWLHVECARSFGAGLIAEDLPEELPKVFTQLDI